MSYRMNDKDENKIYLNISIDDIKIEKYINIYKNSLIDNRVMPYLTIV